MESSKASRSKYRKVYGLPTLRGLFLSAILVAALWFSMSNNSETERWLFLLMILLILVHLTESSQPFRYMHVQVLPFEPPFEGERVDIPVQISNQTNFKLDLMSIKFDDSDEWTEVKSISRRSSTLVHLPMLFDKSGATQIPRIVLKTSPDPRLFRYWRVLDFTETTFVLPMPVDHHVSALPNSRGDDELELTDIEQIRDERLMPLMDHKLFLKTGLPFRRVHESQNDKDQMAFAWSQLEKLTQVEKGQQFSYWIKSASDTKQNFELFIDTPFMTATQNVRGMNWRKLKTVFAQWFYAQA